jgi:hypothetical protein
LPNILENLPNYTADRKERDYIERCLFSCGLCEHQGEWTKLSLYGNKVAKSFGEWEFEKTLNDE